MKASRAGAAVAVATVVRISALRVVLFAVLVFGLAVGGVSPPPAAAAGTKAGSKAAASGTILDAGSPDAVPGQYIVALQPSAVSGTATVTSVAQALTSTYGGTVGPVFDGFQAFTLDATDAIASAMAGDALVSYVDQDQYDQADALPAPPPVQDDPDWGLARINQRMPTLGSDPQFAAGPSAGVTIYMVDTGVQISNPDFGGRASYAYNAFTGARDNAPDCPVKVGHGTPVAALAAGTVYGVAKQALIKSVKVMNCDSNGKPVETQGAITNSGLNWILQNGTTPAVVNISLGANAPSESRAQVVNDLVAKGFTVVMAAGNNKTDACNETPGSKTSDGTPMNAIVVGATSLDKTTTPMVDKLHALSDYGKCVTLFAPGGNVTSASANPADAPQTFGQGTSFAAGYVSGAAAILLAAHPKLTQNQVKAALVADATSPATNGVSTLIAGAAAENSPDLLLHVAPPAPQNTVTVNGPAVSQTVGSGPGAVDFTFSGTAGQSVYVNGTGGAFNANIALYDKMGSQLAGGSHSSGSSGQQESWINPVVLPLTGTYSIHVVPAAGASGTVALQVLTAAAVTATVNGPAVTATIPSSLPGQRILATFAGTAGTSVYVNGTTGKYRSSVTLYDPSGAQIASGNGSSSGSPSSWFSSTPLSKTGTYTLSIVPDAGATGAVTFQVFGSDVTLTPTVDGAAVSGTIPASLPGQHVTAKFTGTAGQSITINGTTPSFHSSVTLFDPTGAQIASTNYYGSSSGSPSSWFSSTSLSKTGTYTLSIVPDPGATGAVTLHVIGSDLTLTPTVDGAAVSGTIPASVPGQHVTVRFAGTAGQSVDLNGATNSYLSVLTLYDPTGTQIGSTNYSGSSSGSAASWFSSVRLSTTGTYTLSLVPDAGATGPVKVQVLGSAIALTPTVDGAAVSGTIPAATPGKRITATFSATAGQAIYINGSTTGFTPWMKLYDPAGVQIASGNGVTSFPGTPQTWIRPTNAPTTGTYTLVINPDATATGDFSLQVFGSYVTGSATVNGAPTALLVPPSAPGKIMAITFSGTAGSVVGMEGITGTVGGVLAMDDPDGAQIASGVAIPLNQCPEDEAPGTCPQVLIVPVTLPLTGTYTVYFTTDPGLWGPLSVELTGAPGAAPPVNLISTPTTVDGAPATVSIPSASAANRVAVTFSATAGQAITVNLTRGTMDCSSQTFSLVGPSGQIVVPQTGVSLCSSPTFLFLTGLPADGTYTLYLFPSSSQTGTFTLQVLSSYVTASATIDGPSVPIAIPSSSPGRHAALTFAGTAGQAIYVNFARETSGCDSQTFSLVGPSGQIIVPQTGISPCSSSVVLPPTDLPATGTYTLYEFPSSTQSGTFGLQVLSKYLTATATVDGPTTTVTIPSSSPGQRAAISFAGNAGQVIYVNSPKGTVDCSLMWFSLVGPSGQVVTQQTGTRLCDNSTVASPTALPATGTYTLYVTPDGDGTFGLQVLSQSVTASATVDGPAVPIAIPSSSPGEHVAVTFSASAGQVVYVNSASGTIDCSYMAFSLIGPSGQLVVPQTGTRLCSAETVISPIAVPATGTYTLYLFPVAGQTGTFALQILTKYVAAAATVDGAAVPITIPGNAPGQRVAETFSATAGQAVSISEVSSTISCSQGARWISLVGPSGQVVVSQAGISDLCRTGVILGMTGLPATGTYTLYISPATDQSGTFSLQAQSYI